MIDLISVYNVDWDNVFSISHKTFCDFIRNTDPNRVIHLHHKSPTRITLSIEYRSNIPIYKKKSQTNNLMSLALCLLLSERRNNWRKCVKETQNNVIDSNEFRRLSSNGGLFHKAKHGKSESLNF